MHILPNVSIFDRKSIIFCLLINSVIFVLNLVLYLNRVQFEHTESINPIWTRQNFLINGPGGIHSTQHIQTFNNSRITRDKKSVFAPREAQFSDNKSKLFVIIFATLIFK